jgi:hypothetical protein
MGRFSEEIQNGINHIEYAIDYINENLIDVGLKANLDEISAHIDDCLSLIYPTEESSNQRRFPENINIKLLHQWVPRLEKLVQNLVPIHYLLSSIIVDKISSNNSNSIPDTDSYIIANKSGMD